MPTFTLCPECDERLSPGARQCACGWKPGGKGLAPDPFAGLCAYTAGGDRCRFPASISHGLKVDGRYLCAFPFFNGDPIHAGRSVANIFYWAGNPASYLRMRKEAASRPRVVTHPGSDGVAGLPVAIRDLVQKLRIYRAKETAP